MSIDLKPNENGLSSDNDDDEHELNVNNITSRSSSEKFIRSQSQTPKTHHERPLSPKLGQRISKQEKTSVKQQRTRSISPRKTFSYLPSDCLNFRKWKEQRRLLAKEEEYIRIYNENRQKLERLAKIAKEPSSYPTINLEQERQRERHAYDHQRKILKSYIPILQNNLCIVERLANVKGVYDIRKMNEDFRRHQVILKHHEVNRKKTRELQAQKPFILPNIK